MTDLNLNAHIGTIFYRWEADDDEPTIIRYIGKLESELSSVAKYIFSYNGKKIICSIDEFNKLKYRMLLPDGFITIGRDIDANGNIADIIITFNRMEYCLGKETSLYAICRQSFEDLNVANTVGVEQLNPEVGMSTNVEDNQKLFVSMMQNYHTITNDCVIAIYKSDTLNSILSLVDTSSLDYSLAKLKERLEKPNSKYPRGASNASSTIRELIEKTYFMYDAYKGLSIYYDPEIVVNMENNTVSNDVIECILDFLGDPDVDITKTYCFNYKMYFDPDECYRPSITVANNDGVYLIGFDYE